MNDDARLTVAVTGPTGDIGRAYVRALEKSPEVGRVVGMARRPFEPADHGWTKTEYRRGDVLDRAAVDALVADADVVVHLAFLIFGSQDETARVNLEGSRNVFEAALAKGATRLVYTSSVAAYGFHRDNPQPLTEAVPARGSEDHYYSRQKADLETALVDLARGSNTDVYVFRPCIVAGPTALAMIEAIPLLQLSDKIPDAIKNVTASIPALRPVVPDPGIEFQLVHEDDVASALVVATIGAGEPGAYNLAGPGTLTVSDVARSLGWYALRIPDLAVDATVKVVSRLPYMPALTGWLSALRVPVLMDCTKARRVLGWEPRYDALATLADTVEGARRVGLVRRPG